MQEVSLAVGRAGCIGIVGAVEGAGMCPSTMARGVVLRGPLASDEGPPRGGGLVGIRREEVREGADAD
ncbi:MAG: hypothetical protein QGF28_02990 [Candidatus Thalassarchaeaceae archaeon]|nr:hypothetical protein [Candidatus Thalassarchaeaceae archaeon]MDP7257230.1 hypothetical protein [Candidatus Thalassarchaeaceae archaeon]MDP7446154.1 hypothetical protein [Candidatus Thalassarchaeaceae archaeon]MDP7648758.1 hypothetical protein [Candidatus Thalassarchaeaceae archaeon]HJL54783.1 hypothetical protein [Candidatus Thalassarchaeaceae archaeon]